MRAAMGMVYFLIVRAAEMVEMFFRRIFGIGGGAVVSRDTDREIMQSELWKLGS